MSTHENSSLPNNAADANLMAVRNSSPLDIPEGAWAAAPVLPETESSNKQDLSIYFHALRRRWLVASAIGLVCALMAAVGVWFGIGEQYTASEVLMVRATDPTLVFDTSDSQLPGTSEFDVFRQTQLQHFKNRYVLTAALRNPLLRQYKISEPDAEAWLMDELSVVTPGEAEVMWVSLSDSNPVKARDLVEATVQAYLSEVVSKETNQQVRRLQELQAAQITKKQEVLAARKKYTDAVNEQGASDTHAMSVQQTTAVDLLRVLRMEQMSINAELMRVEGDLTAQKALLANVDQMVISEFEVDDYLKSDIAAREMAIELAFRKMKISEDLAVVQGGAGARHAAQMQNELTQIEADLMDQRDGVRTGIREMRRSQLSQEIVRLESQADNLRNQKTIMAQQVAAQDLRAQDISAMSVELEMARDDLENLSESLKQINRQIEELEVEQKSRPRVERANGPKSQVEQPIYPDNYPTRMALTLLSMVAGLCLPTVGILWWDTRGRRVNTAAEISGGVGLPVLGSVPMIPARVLGQLGAPTPRNQSWRMRLTESADGIAARLLRKADVEKTRVILVTSAVGGEGKTTLATQLAMSLARNGRRTVLVDFDLRRPSFDEIFGLPLGPGLCEVLRGENDLGDTVQPTGTENLSVATAGYWDRGVLSSLANAAAGPLLDELRADYDFVIVDASPILPVADTRYIAQQVDAVILSVFRDISKTPKVQAACELLDAFGVSAVEAVVTGNSAELRDKEMDYEPQVAEQ